MRRGLDMMAENAELLERHGIDYAGAIERFGGNAALYERLACKYVNDPHFESLAAALRQGDAETAYHEAHSLKGVADNLSFADLYQAASALSDVLHDGDLAAACTAFPTVREAHERVIDALVQLTER